MLVCNVCTFGCVFCLVACFRCWVPVGGFWDALVGLHLH